MMTDGLLSLADFADHVGADFAALDPEIAPAIFTLSIAEPLKAYRGADARAPFTLLFELPGEFVLPQAIYRVRHPALGELGIFMVPIAKTASGITYESVFN